jgi:hypothetical protein
VGAGGSGRIQPQPHLSLHPVSGTTGCDDMAQHFLFSAAAGRAASRIYQAGEDAAYETFRKLR